PLEDELLHGRPPTFSPAITRAKFWRQPFQQCRKGTGLSPKRPPCQHALRRRALRPRSAVCYGRATMDQDVTLDLDGAVATVTLNRPDRRNALSDPGRTALGAALAELRDDATVRIVVVTGAPPVFSAGADAGLRSSMSAEERRQAFTNRQSQFRRLFERATTLLEGLEQPTIAMVNGHAVGGGGGLARAADIRIAAA